MSEHAQPSYGKYLLIWVWLIALLGLSAFFSYLPIGKTSVVLLILGVSLIKTGLVVLFYMHMKSERIVPLWVVAVFPLVLVAAAAALVLAGLSFAS